MKKLTTILLSLLLLLALSACTNNNSQIKDDNKEPNTNLDTTVQDTQNDTQQESQITRDEAIEIALSKAGVTRDAAYDLEAELDREPNGTFWDVDFESGQYEYSYDIDAKTGEVITSHREARD